MGIQISNRYRAARPYQGSVLTGLLVVAVSVFAGDADAQSCNPFTFDKSCPTPETLTFCPLSGPNANTVTTIECESEFVQNGAQPFFVAGARCGNYACSGSCNALETDEICVAGQSTVCLGMGFESVGSPLARQLVCGAGQSCVTRGPFDDICVGNSLGSCNTGELTKGCVGDIATFCFDLPTGTSAFADPLGIDCQTFSGTCQQIGETPSCVVPLGEPCAPPFIECSGGLFCVGHDNDANTFGTCSGTPPPDAGPPPVDAGPPPPDAGPPPVDAGPPLVDAGPPPADAGDPPVLPPGDCGELTQLGACDGDTLRWCQAGRLEERDCTGDGLVCAEVGPATGFNCVEPAVELPECACATSRPGLPAAALSLVLLAAALRRRRHIPNTG